MNGSSSPRNKILAASALLLALGIFASLRGLDAASVARAVLACCAVAGLGLWYFKRRQVVCDAPAPRMQVVSRTGLSGRAAVALVEVDGRSFLIVHGEGFAQVHCTDRSVS